MSGQAFSKSSSDTTCAVDVLTAVLPEKSEHLGDTARSVLKVRGELAEHGVAVRWHLVFDGPADLVGFEPAVAEAADRVLTLPRRCGASTARNSGLVGCDTGLLMPLDGDDILRSEGVLAAVELLSSRPDLGWVAGVANIWGDGQKHPEAGNALRLGPDGRSWPAGSLKYSPERPWVGAAEDAFCPSAVVMRTGLVWDAGGWPAVPVAADKGLLLKVSSLSAGVQLDVPFISYRMWSEQTTAEAGFSPLLSLATTFNQRTLASFQNLPSPPQ